MTKTLHQSKENNIVNLILQYDKVKNNPKKLGNFYNKIGNYNKKRIDRLYNKYIDVITEYANQPTE